MSFLQSKIRLLCRTTAALAVIAAATSCGNNRQPAYTDTGDSSIAQPRPDSILIIVGNKLGEGDARGFAMMCSYPIIREYPLRDIPDAESMVEYFPIIFDDSIRGHISGMTPDAWESYGWRGWSPRDNNDLWLNDKVYAISYYSKAESALRQILAEQEIESLAPELRDGWVPAFCLRDTADKVLYRVDFFDRYMPRYESEGDSTVETGRYRMSVYPDGCNLHYYPSMILNGSMTSEGSAGIRTYIFMDSIGTTTAEYTPDTDRPAITFRRGHKHEIHPVTRAYWRDYITP